MNISNEFAVQMRGITKAYGPIKALDDVNIDIKKGTVHAVLGENGAGKTTLMNVLYGLYCADFGTIYINGNEVSIKNPGVAIANGIGMVHQHFMLVDDFTVTENIVLGKESTKGPGILDISKARRKVIEISRKYGLEVDPDEKIENMSVGMQQRVEILKALYRDIDILILDEPTAVLTPMEIDMLKSTIKSLIQDNKTVIIITHKLKEIKDMADECTIIRRGRYINTYNVKDISQKELAQNMVGRPVKLVVDKSEAKPGDIVFSVDSLTVLGEHGNEVIKNLSLKVRSGEILGIAGVEGNGQHELIKAITGLCASKSGIIKINGNEVQNSTPKKIIDNKISTIHEDRHKDGLVLDFTVSENSILEKYKEKPFSGRGVINKEKISEFTEKIIRDYDIYPKNCKNMRVRFLSGGNQQKLIIGREISNNPNLLIAVQPTRGLDVGAIEYVHKTLIRLRDEGKAILLFSLELDEIMSLSDTIDVIYNGEIVGEFTSSEFNEHDIGLLMAGGSKDGTDGDVYAESH